MLILGILALTISDITTGVIPSLLSIVSVILIIGGFVELFKKNNSTVEKEEKIPPTNTPQTSLPKITKSWYKRPTIQLFVIIIIIAVSGITLLQSNKKPNLTPELLFERKQECSKYTDLANTKIVNSGRVFENDSYALTEIFYSPSMNTCLYAWIIYTTFEPKEIYTIDDLFGGSVFTTSISESFYKELKELKK